MSKNLCKPTILAIKKVTGKHFGGVFTAKWGAYIHKTLYLCKNSALKIFQYYYFLKAK